MASLSASNMETVALFGATGRTGSEFLRLALGAGQSRPSVEPYSIDD
jgi:hypothetical protein